MNLFLFQIVLIYMTTQNVVNLNQSYFPMYLTETLHFEKVNNFLSFLCVRFPRVCAVSVRDLTWFFVVFPLKGGHCLLPVNDSNQWNSHKHDNKTTQQTLLQQGRLKYLANAIHVSFEFKLQILTTVLHKFVIL